MSFSETVRDPCPTVNEAARTGDREALQSLIQEGHPVDVSDNRGWKPTHEAAYGNHIDCLRLLLEQEVTDLKWQSFEGCTALLIASREGHLEVMRLLLQKGADPNLPDSMSEYPLLAAVKTEKLDCVKLLLDHKATVNCQLYCGTSPLHQAASEGLCEILTLLLERGASLDIREEYDITPIFSAAQYGQTNCLKLLLDKAKATEQNNLVNSPADDGATPLFLAAQEGHSDCVQLLLDYCGDANVMTDEPVVLPLHAALQFNRLECVKKLVPVTDTLKLPDCDVSPFYYSMMHDDGQCTQCLVDGGLDVNYQHALPIDDTFHPKIFRYVSSALCFDRKATPLALAALYEYNLRNAEILLEAGARIDPSEELEIPPLLAALDIRNLELVKLLISRGASVNQNRMSIGGNVVLLVCLHYWKGLNLVLNAGAEAKSLLSAPQPRPRIITPATDLVQSRMTEACATVAEMQLPNLPAITSNASALSQSLEEPLENLRGAAQQLSDSVAMFSAAAEQLEASTEQLTILLRMDIPKLLAGARHLMTKADVTPFRLVQRILEFVGNVQLNPNLEPLMASKQEWATLLSITETPRPLAHHARLAIRERLTPSQLISDSAMAALPLPPTVLDYVMFKELDL